MGYRSPRPFLHGTIIEDQPFDKYHAPLHRFWLTDRNGGRAHRAYEERMENEDELDPFYKHAKTLPDDDVYDRHGNPKMKKSQKRGISQKDDAKRKKKMV